MPAVRAARNARVREDSSHPERRRGTYASEAGGEERGGELVQLRRLRIHILWTRPEGRRHRTSRIGHLRRTCDGRRLSNAWSDPSAGGRLSEVPCDARLLRPFAATLPSQNAAPMRLRPMGEQPALRGRVPKRQLAASDPRRPGAPRHRRAAGCALMRFPSETTRACTKPHG